MDVAEGAVLSWSIPWLFSWPYMKLEFPYDSLKLGLALAIASRSRWFNSVCYCYSVKQPMFTDGSKHVLELFMTEPCDGAKSWSSVSWLERIVRLSPWG